MDASVGPQTSNGTSLSSPVPDSVAYDSVSPVYTIVTYPMAETYPSSDLLGDLDAQWIPILYKEGFDAVFGSWMGRYGNPFV